MTDTLSIFEIDDLIDATLDKQHNYGACVKQLGKPSLKKKAYFCQDSNKKNKNSGKQNSTEKQKYSEKQSKKSKNDSDEEINSLPSEYKEEFEELCSVLEYDLGVEREKVEALALMMVRANMKYDDAQN